MNEVGTDRRTWNIKNKVSLTVIHILDDLKDRIEPDTNGIGIISILIVVSNKLIEKISLTGIEIKMRVLVSILGKRKIVLIDLVVDFRNREETENTPIGTNVKQAISSRKGYLNSSKKSLWDTSSKEPL